MTNREPSSIALVTSYPPRWRPLVAITNKLKGEYAQRWGYHFFTDESELVHELLDGRRVPIRGFAKFNLIEYFLRHGTYDWVIWLDADLLITNRSIRIEDLTGAVPTNKDIVLGYDTNGHHSTVFFVRNTQRARDFIWACNNAGRSMFIEHPWHEMEAMRYFLQTPPYNTIAHYLSAKRLCPILHEEYRPHIPADIGLEYKWEPGDWALHLSAMSLEKRVELAEKYADPARHWELAHQ